MSYEQNFVLFEALKHERPWTLEGYREFGGYEAWEKPSCATRLRARRSSTRSKPRDFAAGAAQRSPPG